MQTDINDPLPNSLISIPTGNPQQSIETVVGGQTVVTAIPSSLTSGITTPSQSSSQDTLLPQTQHVLQLGNPPTAINFIGTVEGGRTIEAAVPNIVTTGTTPSQFQIKVEGIDNASKLVTDFKRQLPENSEPKTRPDPPWWNDNCKTAAREKKAAYRRYQRKKDQATKLELNKKRNIFRNMVRNLKLEYAKTQEVEIEKTQEVEMEKTQVVEMEKTQEVEMEKTQEVEMEKP